MKRKISLQQIFNAAWKHFIIGNGKPAVNEFDGGCMYLCKDGSRCAIGLKIPKNHKAIHHQLPFSDLVGLYPSLWDETVKNLSGYELDNFQYELHDSLIEDGKWKYNKRERKKIYKQIAAVHGLKIPPSPKK